MTDQAESGAREIADRLRRYVKAELKRADVTYEELARRLAKMGMPESRTSIAKKLSRGAFSAVFLVAVLKAIDLRHLDVDEF